MDASRQNMNSMFASKNLVNDSFYITYAFLMTTATITLIISYMRHINITSPRHVWPALLRRALAASACLLRLSKPAPQP